MKESTKSTAGLVFAAVSAIGALVVASPLIGAGLSHLTLFESLAAAVILLIVAAAAGYATFPAEQFSAYLARRRNPLGPPVPADLGRELFALLDTVERLWGADSMYGESMAMIGLDILNTVAGAVTPQADPQKRLFVEQAYGYFYGWRGAGRLQKQALDRVRAIAAGGPVLPQALYQEACRGMVDVMVVSANASNSFVQAITNAGSDKVSPYLVKRWNAFAATCNNRVDDLAKLGAKTKQLFGETDSFYVPKVSEL